MLARKKKPDPVLNWHPNFRVVELLPDIKQVRTGFLVNFSAIFAALLALGWTVYTEVQIHNVNHEIALLNEQIDSNSKENEKKINLDNKFIKASKPLVFAYKFFGEPVRPLQLLDNIMAIKPANMIFETLEINPAYLVQKTGQTFVQRITISGTLMSDSSGAFEDFEQKLVACPALKGRIADPTKDFQVANQRDAVGGSFKFSITINLKPSA